MNDKMKNMFASFIGIVPYYISFFFPKKKGLWLFGSWYGQRYADNSKYLFEYVTQNRVDVDAVWVTKSDRVYYELKKNKFRVCKGYIKTMWLSLRAEKAIFVQSKSLDICYSLNGYVTDLIQLWHGIPLKKIGLDDDLIHKRLMYERAKIFVKKYIVPTLYENYALMIACSNEDRRHFSSAFNVPISKIKITGYPRNDALLGHIKGGEQNFKVIYMPTFRGGVGSSYDFFHRFGFNVGSMNEILRAGGVELHIKLHPVNWPDVSVVGEIERASNICFIDNDVDVYTMLGQYDIMITDFSSVYLDFLLTEKPIISAYFAFDEYIEKDRGMYYIYKDVMPAPLCKDWNEVIRWVFEFKERDAYKSERMAVKSIFHKFSDRGSCERVFYEIENMASL